MADLEKVIKGLECCVATIEDCECSENCPYESQCWDGTMYLDLMKDALELLKAQEPRVLTISEALDAEVAWLEQYADPDDGVEPIIQPIIITCCEHGYWECLIERNENPRIDLFIDGFNEEWRCWTARPTDEQRKATPWEPPKEET